VTDALLGPIKGAERREVGGAQMDTVRAGDARIKRIVYQPGFRWSTHMKPKGSVPSIDGRGFRTLGSDPSLGAVRWRSCRVEEKRN
jgi:hypothetical protein